MLPGERDGLTARDLVITKLLIAALLAGPPVVHDLHVRWAGSPECEGGPGVVERLELLAPELSVAQAEPSLAQGEALVIATATIERGPGLQWSVDLDLEGPLGTEHRAFVAESCSVAIDATAVVLAVAIDPGAVAARINWEQPEPEPEPEPEPPRRAPPAAPSDFAGTTEDPSLNVVFDDDLRSEPARITPQRQQVRFGLAALAGGGYGPLRAGSAAVVARVAVFGSRWRAQLVGAWLPPTRPSLSDAGRARVDGFLIGAQGCGVLRAGPIEFPVCAGVEAGAVRAQALVPIQNPETASQPYAGITLGPGLSWAPVQRVALGLELHAVIPLVSGGFALDGQPALGTTPVGVRALAGVEIRLP